MVPRGLVQCLVHNKHSKHVYCMSSWDPILNWSRNKLIHQGSRTTQNPAVNPKTEWFLMLSNLTSLRNGLRSPLKKPALKLFTDLFLWELSGRKEPSQTCSQERDYQEDENNMKQQQIPREYHSGRLTTFVSYLRKSGFKQNHWKRIRFNEHIPDHRHIKTRLQEAAAHLRAKTKYKMVLEVMVQIQLKVTSTKCLLCIRNRLALTWSPLIFHTEDWRAIKFHTRK